MDWLPKSRDVANKPLDILLARFLAKYTAAMKKLEKDRERTIGILELPVRGRGGTWHQ
ncbi:MAG: hypothetical protein ACTS73_06515 [Arsenophonus sp. NEOnobi-MAG3]